MLRSVMDDEGAVAESRRRWGPGGAVSVADQWENARCLVGELWQRPLRFCVRGRGSTWEAAFLDADARLLNASRRRSDRQCGRTA